MLKRNAILATAAELFAEQGFADTTFEDLERAGGHSRGAVNWFFRDKDELAEALVTSSVIMGEIPRRTPRLQSIVDVSILLAVLTPKMTLMRAANRLATDQGKPFYGYLWRTYIPLVTDILAEAQELGEFQPGVDPANVAELWTLTWVGMDLAYREKYDELAEAVDRLNKNMVYSVATPRVLSQMIVSVERGHDLAEAYFAAQAEKLQQEEDATTTS
ncbi:TetR/AcrR family transcriptional regulator (plasmid) [Streptomyces sp. NBC_00015]|uniref:helix-turn-helix domain-containing protein n=1 Tax=Streptomyces sp. NBC_00015 TaxID=2903611 RepID=UPI002F9192F3